MFIATHKSLLLTGQPIAFNHFWNSCRWRKVEGKIPIVQDAETPNRFINNNGLVAQARNITSSTEKT